MNARQARKSTETHIPQAWQIREYIILAFIFIESLNQPNVRVPHTTRFVFEADASSIPLNNDCSRGRPNSCKHDIRNLDSPLLLMFVSCFTNSDDYLRIFLVRKRFAFARKDRPCLAYEPRSGRDSERRGDYVKSRIEEYNLVLGMLSEAL